MRIRTVNSSVKTPANLPYVTSFAEVGSLEVRLAESPREIRAAQALRYRVFYDEMRADPSPEMAAEKRDFDAFDEKCDHLLVVDRTRVGDDRVVGTYRLLRESVAGGINGFYSSQEYDLHPLFSDSFRHTMMQDKQLLELGRSCVHKDYRTNSTIHLLWRGIAYYTLLHNVGYMFGCASLPGTDPKAHAEVLSYLYHEFRVSDRFPVRAQSDRFVEMNMIPAGELDIRQARRLLPPLVKGYLRLGCFIGDGAVIDWQWGSTDVFILLPVERITARYQQHFDLVSEAADSVRFDDAADSPAANNEQAGIGQSASHNATRKI
ncbi:MAG: GNAT family N-acyltransferase [Sphingomonadales bacterium]